MVRKFTGIPTVFLLIKNARYSIRYPTIGDLGRFTAFSSDTVLIFLRGKHLLKTKPFGDLRRSKSRYTKVKDLFYDLCGRLIYDPFVLVIGIFIYPKGGFVVKGLHDIPLLCITLRTLSLVFFACHSLNKSRIGARSLIPLAVSMLSMTAIYLTSNRTKSFSKS